MYFLCVKNGGTNQDGQIAYRKVKNKTGSSFHVEKGPSTGLRQTSRLRMAGSRQIPTMSWGPGYRAGAGGKGAAIVSALRFPSGTVHWRMSVGRLALPPASSHFRHTVNQSLTASCRP